MEVISYQIQYSQKNEIKIHCIGDIHGGIKHCAESMVKAKVQEIKEDPHAYWIGMGDYGEFITSKDPRWDIEVVSSWLHKSNIARDLEKWVINLFKPIKHKCIGLIEGNHEDSIRIHNDDDVQTNICEGLGVRNLGVTCIVRFTFNRRNSNETHVIKGLFAHGAGFAVTKGTKMNRLERVMNIYPTCRMVAVGHMHDKIILELPYLDTNENEEILQYVRVGAVTGSWFKTYEQGVRASYGEKKGYPPTTLGSPTFFIKPTSNKVWVE